MFNKKEYMKKWREKNRVHLSECSRKWKKENPEKIKLCKKRYREKEKNKEKEKKYSKEYRKRNEEKIRQYDKKRREENPEYRRKWRRENPKKVKEQQERCYRKRRKNPKICLDNSMSSVICYALKGKKAGRKWKTLVGYTIEDLMKHLGSKFDENMSWDNYGSYWWIDHKKPRSLFNYEKPEDEEFKECWALENLQPLEAIANRRKGNKYDSN